ncbi:hypothetical protein SAMN05878503_104112 [Cereibacter ovatus]|uniref:Uncharacterized protein n=1 Tax=Cereibacter ovatus TaxID=439529 RepID=A0A285CPV3_9RHOB|nr:hypothetical protein [Cereibacter ovatus]SNX69582.1 hypothetical protein SAMN05878503_104112 [Cereibacter ovatus]
MTAFRRISAGLAAVAVALGLAIGATPAQADSNDVAKAVAGIAALAIIADQIDRNREPDQSRRVWNTQDTYRPQVYRSPQANGRWDPPPQHVWRDRDGRIHNPGNWRDDRYRHDRRPARAQRELPRECLVRARDGRVAYDARCLRRHGFRY